MVRNQCKFSCCPKPCKLLWMWPFVFCSWFCIPRSILMYFTGSPHSFVNAIHLFYLLNKSQWISTINNIIGYIFCFPNSYSEYHLLSFFCIYEIYLLAFSTSTSMYFAALSTSFLFPIYYPAMKSYLIKQRLHPSLTFYLATDNKHGYFNSLSLLVKLVLVYIIPYCLLHFTLKYYNRHMR